VRISVGRSFGVGFAAHPPANESVACTVTAMLPDEDDQVAEGTVEITVLRPKAYKQDRP